MISYTKDTTSIVEISESLVEAYNEGVKSKALLTALGDYWTDYYSDADTLSVASTGAVALYSKEYSALLDMVLSSNIIDVPTQKPVYYQLYTLVQALFSEHVGNDGDIDYIYTDFSGVESIEYLVSSLFEPGVVLEKGKHFDIVSGQLRFYVDVFSDKNIIDFSYVENESPELKVYLWATNVVFSDSLIYNRFGRFVYRYGKDSTAYHNMALAMLKFYADSKSVGRIEAIINIMFGLPFSRYSGEVVTEINRVTNTLQPATDETEASYYEVVTSLNVYYAYLGSKLLVQVGQTLTDYELIARSHLVKDYVTDPEWHKRVAFPKELIVANDGSVSLAEIMDKIVRYNIIYVKLVATFDTYDQYRDTVLEMIGLVKLGIPVYLYPFIDRAFAADFEDIIDSADTSTLGYTRTESGVDVQVPGVSMEQDEYYSRCECGEYSGKCEYWGVPILDHGKEAFVFLPPSKRQYRGDPVYYEGKAYYGSKNIHDGKAPYDIFYTPKNYFQIRFDGKTNYNHQDSSPAWHKAMPVTKEQYDADNYYSRPINTDPNVQLFKHYHTCESDYAAGQFLRIDLGSDTFDSNYEEDLNFIEIHSGRYSDCYITGPIELVAGHTGTYTTTRGIADNIMVSGSMELVGQDDTGFICKLPDGQNEAVISIHYDDIMCSEITVVRASTYFQKPTCVSPIDDAVAPRNATLIGSAPVIVDKDGVQVIEEHESSVWSIYEEKPVVSPVQIFVNRGLFNSTTESINSSAIPSGAITLLDVTEQFQEQDRVSFGVGGVGCFITYFSRGFVQKTYDTHVVTGGSSTYVIAAYRHYYPDDSYNTMPCIIRFDSAGALISAKAVVLPNQSTGGVLWVKDDPHTGSLFIHTGFGRDYSVPAGYSITYLQVSYDLTTVKALQLTQSDNISDISWLITVSPDAYFIAHTSNIVAVSKDMEVLDVITSVEGDRLTYVHWHDAHNCLYVMDDVNNTKHLMKVQFTPSTGKFNPVAERFVFSDPDNSFIYTSGHPVMQDNLELFFFRANGGAYYDSRYVAIDANKNVVLEFNEPDGGFTDAGDNNGPSVIYDEDTGDYIFTHANNLLYRSSPELDIYIYRLHPDMTWSKLYQSIYFHDKYNYTNGTNWEWTFIKDNYVLASGFDSYENPVVMRLPLVDYSEYDIWDPNYFDMGEYYRDTDQIWSTAVGSSAIANGSGTHTFVTGGLRYYSDLILPEDTVPAHPPFEIVTNEIAQVETLPIPFGEPVRYFDALLLTPGDTLPVSVKASGVLSDGTHVYLCWAGTPGAEGFYSAVVAAKMEESVLWAIKPVSTTQTILHDMVVSTTDVVHIVGERGTSGVYLQFGATGASTLSVEYSSVGNHLRLHSLSKAEEGTLVVLGQLEESFIVINIDYTGAILSNVYVATGSNDYFTAKSVACGGGSCYVTAWHSLNYYRVFSFDLETQSVLWSTIVGSNGTFSSFGGMSADGELIHLCFTKTDPMGRQYGVLVALNTDGYLVYSKQVNHSESVTLTGTFSVTAVPDASNAYTYTFGNLIDQNGNSDALFIRTTEESGVHTHQVMRFGSQDSIMASSVDITGTQVSWGGTHQLIEAQPGLLIVGARVEAIDPLHADSMVGEDLDGRAGYSVEPLQGFELIPVYNSGEVVSPTANVFTVPNGVLSYDKLYLWDTKYHADWAGDSPVSDKSAFIVELGTVATRTIKAYTSYDRAITGSLFSEEDQALSMVTDVEYRFSQIEQPTTGTNGGSFTISENGTWVFSPGEDFLHIADVSDAFESTSVVLHTDKYGVRTRVVIEVTVFGNNNFTALYVAEDPLYNGEHDLHWQLETKFVQDEPDGGGGAPQ